MLRKLDYKLQNFPIMIFAITMGLTGLSIVYNKLAFLFKISYGYYNFILLLSTILFVLFFTVYMARLYLYPEKVKAEFNHPIKINFFSTIPINLLLLSISYYFKLNPLLGIVLWYLGFITLIVFLFSTIGHWLKRDFIIEHYNPAWFIPVVGMILVPVVGVEVAPLAISVFSLSVGLLFWIVLLTIVFYRLIFHKSMAPKFMPTLFILIAPPAVALISYVRITMTFNFFAQVLFSLALLFAFLLLTMWRSFIIKEFFLSWWAYTFPLDALAIANILVFEINRTPYLVWPVYLTSFIATVFIIYIFYRTIIAVKDQQLCIEE